MALIASALGKRTGKSTQSAQATALAVPSSTFSRWILGIGVPQESAFLTMLEHAKVAPADHDRYLKAWRAAADSKQAPAMKPPAPASHPQDPPQEPQRRVPAPDPAPGPSQTTAPTQPRQPTADEASTTGADPAPTTSNGQAGANERTQRDTLEPVPSPRATRSSRRWVLIAAGVCAGAVLGAGTIIAWQDQPASPAGLTTLATSLAPAVALPPPVATSPSPQRRSPRAIDGSPSDRPRTAPVRPQAAPALPPATTRPTPGDTRCNRYQVIADNMSFRTENNQPTGEQFDHGQRGTVQHRGTPDGNNKLWYVIADNGLQGWIRPDPNFWRSIC